jgi:hypothetical protein
LPRLRKFGAMPWTNTGGALLNVWAQPGMTARARDSHRPD